MSTAYGLATRRSVQLEARSRHETGGCCGSPGNSGRPQIRPHTARRHAEVLRPLSVATTHQARTRVEPEQHHSLSSHEQTQQQPPETFDWAHQWYSIGSAEDMDPSRPHAITLLGRDLVLWRDQQGDWRAFEDICPHRLAPLSEGRLEEDGTLACSYHGWRFGPDGKCTAIPQATDKKAEQTACASSRSAATSYPVQVAEDLIWVWGSSGSSEHIHAAAKRPNVTREADTLPEGQKLTEVFKMYTRDLPYDWQILVENFLDPSHVPFAHHGVQGNRYSEGAGDIQMEPTEGFKDGLSFDTQLRTFNPKKPTMTKIQFFPPSLVRYFTEREEGFSTMNLMVTPIAPGRSRVTFRLLTNIDSKFIRMAKLMPRWLDHVKTRSFVFDGDNYLLHVQERILAKEAAEGRSWKKGYFMPAVADRFVTAFRLWMDANGGSVGWAPGVSTELPARETSREALLDRYHSHTKHCPSCSGALAGFKALRVATVVVGVGMLLGLSSVLGRGAAPVSPLPIGLLAGAAASAAAWRLASEWVQKFYFVDYVHQEHH